MPVLRIGFSHSPGPEEKNLPIDKKIKHRKKKSYVKKSLIISPFSTFRPKDQLLDIRTLHFRRASALFPGFPLVPPLARHNKYHTSIHSSKIRSPASFEGLKKLFVDLQFSNSLDGISNRTHRWSIPSLKNFVQAFAEIAAAGLGK